VDSEQEGGRWCRALLTAWGGVGNGAGRGRDRGGVPRPLWDVVGSDPEARRMRKGLRESSRDISRAISRSPGHIGGRRGKAYEAACTERGIKPSKTQYQGDLGVLSMSLENSNERVRTAMAAIRRRSLRVPDVRVAWDETTAHSKGT